jgi:hypothetical protein
MNKAIVSLLLLGFCCLVIGTASAAETKTDPSRDVFVENSTTNFVLTAKSPQPLGRKGLGFELLAPDPGVYTVVCFIDGKPQKPAKLTLPGIFALNTRGMAPGPYRITLQLIDSQGRVGSNTQMIQIK